jgi:hypothetical protein
MPANVRKTPAYLKGLAETRARADGEIQRLERLSLEIVRKLAARRADRESCDRLIKRYDGPLDPTEIEPVRGWRPDGGRGKRRVAIIELLQSAGASAITTTDICWELQLRFGLEFDTPTDRDRWVRG